MSPKKRIRRTVKLHVSEYSTEDSTSDTSSSLKKVTDKIRQKLRRREERVKNMIRIHKKRKRSTRKTEYERSEDSSTCNDKNVEMRPTATQQLSDPETDDEDGNSNFSPNADGMQIIDTEIDSESGANHSETASEMEDKITESPDSDQEFTSESNGMSSESENHSSSFSEEHLSEAEQPVCQGTRVRRRTFEATLLALSKKHNFSKSARTHILKFLETFLPKPNAPSCNYTFEKMLIKAMDIHYSSHQISLGS